MTHTKKKCFVMLHMLFILHLVRPGCKDKHKVFWWKNLHVNRTFVSKKTPQGAFWVCIVWIRTFSTYCHLAFWLMLVMWFLSWIFNYVCIKKFSQITKISKERERENQQRRHTCSSLLIFQLYSLVNAYHLNLIHF